MSEQNKPEFTRAGVRFGTQAPGLLARVLTVILGAAFLILAFMFSLVVLAVGVTAGLLAWAYIWWKTRKLRQQIREQPSRKQPSSVRIIEGEVIRDTDDSHGRLR